jgi:hypothetical protein
MDIKDEDEIKTLDTINDFPHVGLLSFENSGENLLRFYLEHIFKIKTQSNIKKEFLPKQTLFQNNTNNLDLSWIICSDFPIRFKFEYIQTEIAMAIIITRNPIEVIMSLALKDSILIEDSLNKADELIKQWKLFHKYWINAPIPVYIVKYEELLEQPLDILKDLARFVLGIKTIDETKIDYAIQQVLSIQIKEMYFAYNASVKQNASLSDNVLSQFQEKFLALKTLMHKFKYSDDEDNIDNNDDYNWIDNFNKENLIKSVELQELMANSVLTSTYYALRLC